MEGQHEQRLRILPTPFMCFILHFCLDLLVSIKRRRPGFPSAQRARTGPGLASCSLPWPETLWVGVEFSPADASQRQLLAALSGRGSHSASGFLARRSPPLPGRTLALCFPAGSSSPGQLTYHSYKDKLGTREQLAVFVLISDLLDFPFHFYHLVSNMI